MAIWWVMRIAFSVLVFALIATLFGAFSLTTALAAIGPAVLTGIAFAAPVSAWTASIENDVHLSTFFRFAIMPLFLFSGTFFPITNLPSWLQPVAFVSPLWHGVELTRGVAGLPGSPRWPWQIHTGILVALTAVGLVLAVRKFSKRLRV
jgi:lipooligosaccharide transport system permease protein